jgi:protein-disulfide isomerase
MMHRVLGAALALCGVLALACQTGIGGRRGAEPTPRVAEVDGVEIQLDDLDTFVKEELFLSKTRGGQSARVYEVRAEALQRLIARRAVEQEAKRRGLTGEELVRARTEAQEPVSDAEIATLYAQRPDKLADVPFEEAAPSIRHHLEERRRRRAVEEIVAAASVSVYLRPPRVDVAADGPALGPEDAPVTIVEFSDFQCPYCRRAGPIVHRIAEKYPTQVRVVYRHLPLDKLHPRARATAEASLCADDQGRFWAYHDLLFANPRALEDDDLLRYAADVGAETDAFAACLKSRTHARRVSEDAAAAASIGVTGTPAFVVNGIVLFGLQSEENLDAVIQSELAEAG